MGKTIRKFQGDKFRDGSKHNHYYDDINYKETLMLEQRKRQKQNRIRTKQFQRELENEDTW